VLWLPPLAGLRVPWGLLRNVVHHYRDGDLLK